MKKLACTDTYENNEKSSHAKKTVRQERQDFEVIQQMERGVVVIKAIKLKINSRLTKNQIKFYDL